MKKKYKIPEYIELAVERLQAANGTILVITVVVAQLVRAREM